MDGLAFETRQASAIGGVEELNLAVAAFYEALDLPTDPTIREQTAGLPPELAGGLAIVLEDLLSCHRITVAVESQALALWDRTDVTREDVPWAQDMQACGEKSTLSVEALSDLMDGFPTQSASAGYHSIDLWPVVHVDFHCSDDTYLWDYILLVDECGNDEYFNNAGGTVIDVMRGPPGSVALSNADSRGCQSDAELNTATGNCVLSGGAALLDKEGNDQYQRKQSSDLDAAMGCTTEPVVRRLATTGSGVIGVGILIDKGGNDVYYGKLLSIGMGHSGGFGLLRDYGGSDEYRPIRSSAGAGVLVGVGVLEDRGHDDDLYHPEPHPGGVINNENVCREGNDNLFGAGLLVGGGIMVEHGGDDQYGPGLGATVLGDGQLVGVGVFKDLGGDDDYTDAPAPRDDGVSFAQPSGAFGVDGVSVFHDSGL